jgi:hypothetical protein
LLSFFFILVLSNPFILCSFICPFFSPSFLLYLLVA